MIYIASCYSAHTPGGDKDIELEHYRYIEACIAAGLMLKEGKIVYSPIVHWHLVDQLFVGEFEYDQFLEVDVEMLNLCSEVHVLMNDGWKESKGVKFEIEYAKLKRKPVKYFTTSKEGIKYEDA